MPANLLLVAPALLGEPVADAIRLRLDLEVELVPTASAAMACLRRGEYGFILLEESLTTGNPDTADLLYEASRGALLIEINFVLTNTERIIRQVRYAMMRREQDRKHARTAVVSQLNGELNTTLTGLLLESQLALREAHPEMQPKLRNIVGLASELRNRLQTKEKTVSRR
jgi:hypothetical protein